MSVTKSPYFFNACKKSTNYGKGYVPPISKTISTILLKRSKEKVTRRHTCCTIITNGWLDMCHRMQINVLVCYPKEILFYKVVDTTYHKKSSVFIFNILESHSWNSRRKRNPSYHWWCHRLCGSWKVDNGNLNNYWTHFCCSLDWLVA